MEKFLLLLRAILPFSAISALALYAVGYQLIPVLYGREFLGSAKVMAYLLPGTVFMTPFLFMHFYAAGQGMPHMALRAFIPATVVSFGLSWALIPQYGYSGAAVSTSLGYVFGVAVYFYFFKKRYPCTISDAFLLKWRDLASLRDLSNGKVRS